MANRLSRESVEIIGYLTPKGNILSRQSVEVLAYIGTPPTVPVFRIILI